MKTYRAVLRRYIRFLLKVGLRGWDYFYSRIEKFLPTLTDKHMYNARNIYEENLVLEIVNGFKEAKQFGFIFLY